MNFNSNIKEKKCTIKFSEVTPNINLVSGSPRVRLQSVLDHQFRIEFPSTGEKRDPSIPGARKMDLIHSACIIKVLHLKIRANTDSKQRMQMKDHDSSSTYLQNLLRSELELDVHCRH